MTEVLLSERARDRLSDLETGIQERIKDALRELNPARYLSRLSGEDVYKLRVGDYRVIADWDREEEKVYILTVGHRRNIYDRDW
jgi:mRNA interferase RelE/StbE